MDYLTSDQLVKYVETVATNPTLWHDLASVSDKRSYELLISTPVLNAWVISWNNGHDTGLHDHDGSAGGVIVVQGHIIESRLEKHEHGNCIIEREHDYHLGSTFQFGPFDIHRVRHAGANKGPAVTIHAYSPPLKRMGSYGFNEYDEFNRLPMEGEEELRPLELALKKDGSYQQKE